MLHDFYNIVGCSDVLGVAIQKLVVILYVCMSV